MGNECSDSCLRFHTSFHIIVNGNWGRWRAWSTCSVTCDTGLHTRHRYCDSPDPANGGNACPGVDFESEACIQTHCQGKQNQHDGYIVSSLTNLDLL